MPSATAGNASLAIVLVAMALSGCAPSFSVFDTAESTAPKKSDWKGPTVRVLVNHITCELENDYRIGTDAKNPDRSLWLNLSKYNFVAAVDLNLLLTQIEGVNPGYSGITPLDALGNIIPIQSTTTGMNGKPVTTFASGTYNRTLAIGGQLSGTQDNAIDLTYVIDMNQIAAASDTLDERDEIPKPPPPGMPDCRNQGSDLYHLGLRGGLELETNVREVLNGIDASGGVNVYGTSGPFGPATTSAPPTPPPTHGGGQMTLQLFTPSVAAAGAKSGASSSTGGGASAATSTPSTTGFSFKIDFTVLGGLSGGPIWTLLQAKYPVAGGSSSGQLLNYSLQTLDTLTMTFAPTCQGNTAQVSLSDFKIDDKTHLDFWFANQAGGVSLHALSGIDPAAFASINASGAIGVAALGSGGLIFSHDEASNADLVGTISWSGFVRIVRQTVVGSATDKNFVAELSGTVTKSSTQRPVGRLIVYATISTEQTGNNPAKVLDVKIFSAQATDGAPAILVDDSPSGDYWKTIPYCDTLTGPVIQNIWNNAAAQTQLFKLNSTINHQ